jgi:hypothetical protein
VRTLVDDRQLTLDNTTLLEALAWRDANREAYQQIVLWAHEDARERGYCSMQAYMEALRSPAIARRLGLQRAADEPFVVNHNLRSGLTRLVLLEYPDLPFRPRRSKCDPVDPVPTTLRKEGSCTPTSSLWSES